jgi:hypothetical protein
MRLADIIRQCKAEGVQSCKLHPDGTIAELTFAPATNVAEKKKLTKDEEIEEAKKKRNPRRNALDVALEAQSDLRSEQFGKA